jgi:hypothetical protein
LEKFFPNLDEYLQLMESRPHTKTIMVDRAAAMIAFVKLNIKYEG